MNKLYIIGAVVSAVALGAAATPLMVSAQGPSNSGSGYGSSNGLEIRAQAVDMTSDQLKTQLETKSMTEVASDQGLSLEQYQANVQAASKARWEDRGLSEEQTQERAQDQAVRQADCDGTGTRINAGAGLGQQDGNGYKRGQEQ